MRVKVREIIQKQTEVKTDEVAGVRSRMADLKTDLERFRTKNIDLLSGENLQTEKNKQNNAVLPQYKIDRIEGTITGLLEELYSKKKEFDQELGLTKSFTHYISSKNYILNCVFGQWLLRSTLTLEQEN